METLEKEIIEGNKLISEFMGLKVIGNYAEAPNGINQYTFEYNTPISVKYHESWDWLMPVVSKIICEWETHPRPRHEYLAMKQAIESHLMPVNYLLRIDLMWKAVVEFINWYNDNKK